MELMKKSAGEDLACGMVAYATEPIMAIGRMPTHHIVWLEGDLSSKCVPPASFWNMSDSLH